MKNKFGKRILSIVLALTMIVTLIPSSLIRVEAATVEATSFTRINVQTNKDGVYDLAQAMFAGKNIDVELVYNQTITTGDIVVKTNGNSITYGNEGYRIDVVDTLNTITVTSATNKGARYGLNDVLQQLEKGTVSSVDTTTPYKETRSLFVDTARKYFGVSWFENIIREMSWNGMNTLYISFSNDEGFRLLLDDMSLSYDDGNGETISYNHEFMAHLVDNPEKLADSEFLTERNANATDEGASRVVTNYDNNYYYTQDDMEKIIAYAKAYGIEVIPEFNTPGHFGQVLWYFPEYRITGTWYEDGQPHYGLDLTNAEAYNFGQAIVKKYIDFFASQGVTSFCVGGDEYSKGNATNEQVAAYTNELATYAENNGMTVYAWNDGQAAANGLLKDSVIVNAWNGTSNYNLINFDSSYLYYVLKAYEWKPNAQTLFESWSPNTYNNGTDLSSNLMGASLAIWCDVPNKETPAYVLESMIPIIQAFGYKMWNYKEISTTSLTTEYDSYSTFISAVTNAPEVEETTVLAASSTIATEEDVTLPEPSLGDGYELVTFNTPTVSTTDGWYSGANNLIDGDTSTVAWTNGDQSVGDYMLVDLGSLQTVDTITVTSPNHSDICTNANVQISADGLTWTTLGTHSGNNSETVTNNFTVNAEIQYIRIVITESKSNWWQISEISWSPKAEVSTIEDGTYIIVNGTNKAMTNTVSGSGFANSTVTINGTIATPFNSIYEWTFEQQSDGTYYVTDTNGQYLNISGSGISVSTTPQAITATISGGKVLLSNGDNGINYYAGNGQIFSRWDTNTSDANNMQTLYKKLTGGLSTISLYNAIVDAKNYNNDDNRYGADEFAALQTILSESITLYKNASESNTSVTQEQIDAQTEKLLNAIDALVLSDLTLNYIEIPVEILDFKADGVMFEYAQNTANKGLYELLIDTKFGGLTYGNVEVPMPGEVGDRLTADEWHISDAEPMGWYENCKRTGLVENYLVNNAPVYKETTVDYVAKLIAKGYFTDLSTSVSNWNDNISEKITELYSDYDSDTDTNENLGSWDNTLGKTSTGENGGTMTWASVATCYDLAYYILNNMWRSTEAADGADAYNTKVDDRTILRMLAGDDGYYYLDSTKEISYTGNYIYNTDLTTENTAETKFTPINDLGYESSEKYGDTTDITNGINFHFSMHAYGSFVYNADDNLYFYFDGDDDVYFYINGQLVMDLGGAHAHCDDEIYLNNIADELGLVDGGIYTFDMFYAERHTTQANLEFRTNIKIMDTMSTTSKGQYNATTGESIAYGAIVNPGTTVAYSFNLLNLRSVNVTDITFVDESLGSSLSGTSITLYDASKTNGATTDITDIKVYYHTYDRPAPNEQGTLNTDALQTKTVAEITEMINTANAAPYASLESGSYVVSISTEEELKSLLELGIPIDTQIRVYGVKRNVTVNDRPYINTVTSRAYYTSNNRKVALNGIASQKLTVLNSFTQVADKEQIVVDFGKDITINLENVNDNIYLNSNDETNVSANFVGITNIGSHNQIRTTSPNAFTGGVDENNEPIVYTSTSGVGGYTLLSSNITFSLNNFLSNVERVYAVYEIVDSSLDDTEYAEYYLLVEIDIIPATMVYYETDFSDNVFTYVEKDGVDENTDANQWYTVGTSQTDNVQDDGTVGNGQTYGNDSSYENDLNLSNGSSMYVEGEGRNNTQTLFSFTGTGFDLISRTGTEQGAIRVDVYSDAAMTTKVKTVTVINKSESNLELYQIPVVSINDLDYGTYYVKIGVNAAYTAYTTDEEGNQIVNEALSQGNQFHFDAIRIYDPINITSASDDAITAKSAYLTDGEYAPEITEVRSILLDESTYSEGTAMGALFVDRTQTGVNVSLYETIGPNNEVYLQPNEAIIFKITADLNSIASVDIGAKSADGNPVVLTTILANSTDTESDTYKAIETETEINSSTSLYYDIQRNDTTVNELKDYFNDNGEGYVIITNTGNEGSILSITDIKIAYKAEPTVTTFSVDEDVIDFATAVFDETKCTIYSASFTSSTRFLRTSTLQIVTSNDVETLYITNKYGSRVYGQTTSTINEEGNKVWTVKFIQLSLGKQTYTITGYDSENNYGESTTVETTITLF